MLDPFDVLLSCSVAVIDSLTALAHSARAWRELVTAPGAFARDVAAEATLARRAARVAQLSVVLLPLVAAWLLRPAPPLVTAPSLLQLWAARLKWLALAAMFAAAWRLSARRTGKPPREETRQPEAAAAAAAAPAAKPAPPLPQRPLATLSPAPSPSPSPPPADEEPDSPPASPPSSQRAPPPPPRPRPRPVSVDSSAPASSDRGDSSAPSSPTAAATASAAAAAAAASDVIAPRRSEEDDALEQEALAFLRQRSQQAMLAGEQPVEVRAEVEPAAGEARGHRHRDSMMELPDLDGGSAPPSPRAAAAAAAPPPAAAAPKTDPAQRKRAAAELIATEKSYVGGLRALIQYYVKPMRQMMERGDLRLTDAQREALFRNVETLVSLHETFYSDMSKAGEEGDLGAVVLRYAHFLKMYTSYVSDFNRTMQVVQQLGQSRKFVSFQEQTRKTPAVAGLDLMSLLITPVQRIPRYEMLLRELIKHTPSDTEHAKSLSAAYERIRQVCAHVNETKRMVENMQELMAVESKVRDVDWSQFKEKTFIEPSRRLLRYAPVLMRSADLAADAPPSPAAADGDASARQGRARSSSRGGGGGGGGGLFSRAGDEFKRRQMIVFNDCVMWLNEAHKYKGLLTSASLKVRALPDSSARAEATFQLLLSGYNFTEPKEAGVVLGFESAAQRDEWQRVLQQAVADAQARRERHERTRERAHAQRTKLHSSIDQSLRALRVKQSAMSASASQASGLGASETVSSLPSAIEEEK